MKHQLFGLFAFAVLTAPAHAEPFQLLCRASVDGRPSLVQVIAVDLDRQTVDGVSATVSAAEIKWHTRDNYGATVHTLNRLAGTLQSWPEGRLLPAMPPLFSCEKASSSKF